MSRRSPPPGRGIPEGPPLLGVPALAKYIAELEKEVTRAQAAYSQERERRLHASSPGPHSARSSGDPPATQRLEGQEGEREVGSKRELGHENSRCEESQEKEVAPSIPQILRHRGTDLYRRLTPRYPRSEKPVRTRCRTATFKTPPPLDQP
ncbi:unnamed protein product, partial [Trichogramma brassicae]